MTLHPLWCQSLLVVRWLLLVALAFYIVEQPFLGGIIITLLAAPLEWPRNID